MRNIVQFATQVVLLLLVVFIGVAIVVGIKGLIGLL